MDSPPRPRTPANPPSGGTAVRSDLELDPRLSTRSQTSKRRTDLMHKGSEDARSVAMTKTVTHIASSHRFEEAFSPPLRQALARRSVKRKIFTYMDHGDKKTEIESRTGLSHECIKWHRQLWRTECSHPRPRSKKVSRSPSRRVQSPSPRSERLSKKRPACDGKGESLAAGECSSGKRRRKHVVNQPKGRSVCAVTGTNEPGELKCVEREEKSPESFLGKENIPDKVETMLISVLPIRDLGSQRV